MRHLLLETARSVKRGARPLALAFAVDWIPGGLEMRRWVLRQYGIVVDPTARLTRGVRFSSGNVRIESGARIGRGARFEGLARITIPSGAVVPPGTVIDTASGVALASGAPLHTPIAWSAP